MFFNMLNLMVLVMIASDSVGYIYDVFFGSEPINTTLYTFVYGMYMCLSYIFHPLYKWRTRRLERKKPSDVVVFVSSIISNLALHMDFSFFSINTRFFFAFAFVYKKYTSFPLDFVEITKFTS